MPPRIMVIDAEPASRSGYESILRQEGFHVLSGNNQREALKIASEEEPDLMIVHLRLQEVQGAEICQKIRQIPKMHAVPLLIISGDHVDGLSTRCLNNGADAYLAKPADSQELIAHVRAILRRPRNYLSTDTVIRKKRIIIRLGERKILFDNKTITHLTPKEYELLREIVSHSPQVVEKNALVTKIWGISLEELGRRSLDVHIQRLRHKLGMPASSFLKTVSLIGYQWLDPSAS